MDDISRGNSLPPDSNDVQSLLNPAYSGSLAASDGSEGIRYSSSRPDTVGLNIGSNKPEETQLMRTIKYLKYREIILFILFGILAIALFFTCISVYSSTNKAVAVVSDLEAILDIATLAFPDNATDKIPTTLPSSITVIPSTVTTTESLNVSTTTTISSTTPYEHSQEMRDAYRNFTERFNRTFSENGLDNYAVNKEFISGNPSVLGETEFVDLSEEQLRKLLTPAKDQKRNDTSKRCDIHKYYGDRTESNIIGSNLYESHDKVPSRVDLRRRGIISEVKNQGTSCNAGYSFAVTSLLESMVDTNGSRLSVQMLLASDFNHHCEGGETFRAMRSAAEDGIVTEDILPFDETQQWHNIDENATRYQHEQACLLTGSKKTGDRYWDSNTSQYLYRKYIVTGSTYIKQFLSKFGAVVVEVPVDRSFFFYKNGPYSPNCNNTSIIGYQPAIILGYAMKNGINVWILRNSFGTEWGIDGDLEMAMDSDCGQFEYAFTFYKTI